MIRHILHTLAALTLALLPFAEIAASATETPADTANSYAKGCELFTKNEFRAAAKEFEMAAAQVQSSDIYYNLGNCYYRLNDYAQARLAYERALRISPSNSDARYNLKITVAKIKSQGAQPQSFITSWINDLVYSQSIGRWTACALVLFGLVLAGALIYCFANAMWMRKTAFFAGLIFLFVSIFSIVCAGIQTHNGKNPTEAIVLKQSDVRQSPSTESKALQQMLPGAKVRLISGGTLKGWQQISLGGGQKGWISSRDIGKI